MINRSDIENLADEQLLEEYYIRAIQASQDYTTEIITKYSLQAGLYLTELQRRNTEKTSKVMGKWTIAIGIMTAVMLFATLVNVVLFIVRG